MSKAFQFLLDLGLSVSNDPHVDCLLGLGSMSETSRMDEYSDMDFFLIVEKGFKQHYIDDLSWLAIKPIVFRFKNTRDGHKVLFDNDVFAEFAVFEKEELPEIGFTEGKIIYQKNGFDEQWVTPRKVPIYKPKSVDFLVNESLSNLYIGLKRECRGEHASAFSFIQVYAASLIVELFDHVYEQKKALIDPYVFERRIENRFTEAFDVLSQMKQGYLNNKASAKAALAFLNTHFKVNQSIYQRILDLAE